MTSRTILCLHDFACGEESWSELTEFLEQSGWRCEAPTLFHHLRTIGAPPDALSLLTLGDYVRAADDYARCIADDEQVAPIVIGHGLGGLIAQKLVERQSASAGIFIAPFAPADCGPAFRSMAVAYANILLTPASERMSSPVRPWRQGSAWGLMGGLSKPQRERALNNLRFEPGRLVNDLIDLSTETTGAGCIDARTINAPTLTIGGGRDRICPIATVRNVAKKYANAATAGDYSEHEALGHWMIAGTGANAVRTEIRNWLDQRFNPQLKPYSMSARG